MLNLVQQIGKCIAQQPKKRQPVDYRSLRNGKLNYKPGFNTGEFSTNHQPALILDQDQSPDFFLASSSIGVNFNLKDLLHLRQVPLDTRMADHIGEISLQQTSLRLLQSKKGELNVIQDKLSQIIEQDRIDLNSFSQNNLTNVMQYDALGMPIGIKTIPIDSSSKRYKEQETLNHAPHPIRGAKKRAVKLNQGDFKTTDQILQQFDILGKMFTLMDEKSQSKQQIPYRQILDLVSLNEDSDYNDLWGEIMQELSLEKEKINQPRRIKTNQDLGDSQFNKVIARIIKEATQYQQENFAIQQVQEQQEEIQEKANQKENANIQGSQQKNQQNKVGFEAIRIQKKAQTKGKQYQWAIQDNTDLANFYDQLPRQRFALNFSFQLDQFQKRSVLHLQKRESVFVAAHTSAGKTVVAEYGIALAIKHKRKVIYTSPIKALSNQKYRQLSKRFPGHVGIVTGDVTMNPQASCVIMTTQILRNNLYRGAQMIRDIQWVIFDQVHYINNQERGVVWQETIIMLPQHIGLIMLSATVPNYMDFANWVGRTKRRVIYVMKTLHRPVPLEHSLYIFGKMQTIKEPNGRFLKQDYNALKDHINSLARGAQNKKAEMKQLKKKKIQEKGFYNDNRRQQRLKLMNKNAVDKFIKKITKGDLQNAQGKEDFRVLQELIAHCQKNNLLPCVVFTFSKKKINALAQKIYGFDLTNRSQKSKIMRMIAHAFNNLKPQDRQLPQLNFLIEICLNGYAIHHGDLLPIAKEIVELLFSQGLIKVLFATQTFAMGINMPTKTVIFHAIKKPSGSQGGHRFLNSSEYVQMSGRAGRRGLDQKGNVIIIAKDPGNLPQSEEMVRMMDYPGEHLTSKFKVTYQIILNLYNNKDINVQEMMRQSFYQDPKFKQFTSNIRKVKQLQQQYSQLSQFDCPYNRLGTRLLMQQYVQLASSLRDGNAFRFKRNDFKKAQLPRFALILGHNNQTQICLLLRMQKTSSDRTLQVLTVNHIYLGLQLNKQEYEKQQAKLGIKKRVILQFDKNDAILKSFKGSVEGTDNQYQFSVDWVRPQDILQVYKQKLAFRKQLDDTKKIYAQIATQLLNPPKVLTPMHNELQQQKLYEQFTGKQCHNCELKEQHLHQYGKRTNTKAEVSTTAARINTNELGLMGSFEGMLKLLNEFKFINENALTLKGRIARQVDIYVAQIIVQAVLDPLNPPEIAALMSAFVCDFKPRPNRGQQLNPYNPFNDDNVFTAALDHAVAQTHKIVHRIAQYEVNNGAYINFLSQEQLVFSIVNFHLTDTVYKWACGFDFVEAREDSSAPQGTIVRTIMRLNILLTNLKSVCRLVGNSELENKVDQAIEAIKRDIVFCQSLYLSA